MDTDRKIAAITILLADPFVDFPLTIRERDIVRLTVRGFPVSYIANQLGISRQTAYDHLNKAIIKIEDILNVEVGKAGLTGVVIDLIEKVLEL